MPTACLRIETFKTALLECYDGGASLDVFFFGLLNERREFRCAPGGGECGPVLMMGMIRIDMVSHWLQLKFQRWSRGRCTAGKAKRGDTATVGSSGFIFE